MTPQISELIEKIRGLESELDAELAKRSAKLRIGLEHGRIAFEEELLRCHRELRQKLLPYLFGANPLVVLTAPVIYAGIVPFLLLDLFVSIFQAVCFPIYGIAKIKRADYFVSTATISPISMRWRSSTAPIAPTPTASSPSRARSRRAPSNTGARSSMRAASSARTRATPCSMITAMARAIRSG